MVIDEGRISPKTKGLQLNRPVPFEREMEDDTSAWQSSACSFVQHGLDTFHPPMCSNAGLMLGSNSTSLTFNEMDNNEAMHGCKSNKSNVPRCKQTGSFL